MRHLILIGMPGSGKTTVGALVAQALGVPLLDTDALVEAAHGPIPEIFASQGEKAFRALECEAAAQAMTTPGGVIATGGGIVTHPPSMSALAGGVLVFLDRPPEDIASENHSGRPLIAGDAQRVFELYNSRINLYQKYAQYTISNQGTAAQAAAKLLATLKKAGELG